MDPLSLIGGISAAGAIIAAIATTVQNLYDIRGRYDEADLTIRLLIVELNTIKAALIHIQDWAQYSFAGSPTQKELLEGFEVSLEGCKMAMDVLAEEVARLVSKNPFIQRTQYAWNAAGMKEHQDRLRSQVAALHLLLQAAHWLVYVSSEREFFFLTSHLVQSNRYSAKIAAAAPGKSQDYPEGHRRHIHATGNDPWLSQQSSNHCQSP
jgi:hypothetical protein